VWGAISTPASAQRRQPLGFVSFYFALFLRLKADHSPAGAIRDLLGLNG